MAARQAQRFLLKVGNRAADAHGELSAWIGGDVDAAGRAVDVVEEIAAALEAVEPLVRSLVGERPDRPWSRL
jgi:hypothetical protein